MSTHAPSASDTEALSKDTVFSLLSNQRRRYVIHYLHRTPEPASLRDLTEQVAAWENGVTVEDLEYKQRKRVYTSLHQTHLPKLVEAGIVEYDRDEGTVALTDRAAALDTYLELGDGPSVPWGTVYLTLSTVTAGFVAGGWLGVAPLSSLPELVFAGGVVALFATAAGTHYYLDRQRHRGDIDTPPDD
ncbi:DUF7344 domain-containing protein [Haloplanus sp. C73]|uniref:DUF7344 domain-containing protein n=1 Tax=Haloplanus sp. C73 TaxID=3421641 RepID=UPI003EB98033